MRWKELVAAALLGSERHTITPPSPDTPLEQALVALDWSDREGALLGAAALLSLYRRAGQVPATRDTAELDIPSVCEPNDLPCCSPRSTQHLDLMMQGRYTEVLPEWLGAVGQARQRVPSERLPDLLELGRARSALREAIVPVIGKRGHWLAAQNPDWDYATVDILHRDTRDQADGADDAALSGIWQTGGREARRALLSQVVATDSARARELIASTWSEESADDRAVFVSMLSVKLSMEDETFLEAALGDRSKNVRRVVADLLATLPESRLSQRMLARVRPLLTLKRGVLTGKGKLTVTLPDGCDAAMKRDGVEPKPPDKKMGEKAWWLRQMLAIVPPSFWCQQWNITPSELLKTVKKHEWEEALVYGWARAAQRHQDIAWAEALLAEWPKRIGDGIIVSLLEILPDDHREAFILQQLQTSHRAGEDEHTVIDMLANTTHQWSARISLAFVEYLRHTIANENPKRVNWHLQTSIKRYAHLMRPDVVDAIRTGWPTDAPAWPNWVHTIDTLLALLQFRSDMLTEIWSRS